MFIGFGAGTIIPGVGNVLVPLLAVQPWLVGAAVDIRDGIEEWRDAEQNDRDANHYDVTNINDVSASAEFLNATVSLNQDFDFQGVINSLDGVQYAINQQSEFPPVACTTSSYAISQPRYTENPH